MKATLKDDGAPQIDIAIPFFGYKSHIWIGRNEAFMQKHAKRSRIHVKKPQGKPIPGPIIKGNAAKSKIQSPCRTCLRRAEGPHGLFVRTIAIGPPLAEIPHPVTKPQSEGKHQHAGGETTVPHRVQIDH